MLKYGIVESEKELNPPEGEHIPFSSNEMRLSSRQWAIALIVLIVLFFLFPFIWVKVEKFVLYDDYRLPYELSNDYWLYERYCQSVCSDEQILILGDSVIWGQYVKKDQTLSHYLNQLAGQQQFANMGMDGMHPAALLGLIKYYGGNINSGIVFIHFNPLWLSSSKHDLQTEKEFSFNHPSLVPQLIPDIPCYKASLSERTGIIFERSLSFLGWIQHLRLMYFADNQAISKDFADWLITHPYDNPFQNIAQKLQTFPADLAVKSKPPQTGANQYELPWVDLDTSLQWKFFRQLVRILQQRQNKVFVIVGPFNEHMLSQASAAAYKKIKINIEAWLQDNNIRYYAPEALPAELYADASHPTAEGYAMLSSRLSELDIVKSFLKQSDK